MQLSKSIRTAYYTALNGVITHNGKTLGIYDSFALPEDVNYPYIILSTQTNVQRGLKRCKMWNASILIDIVTGSTDPIGRSQSEDIAEQVDNIVNPDTFVDLTLLGGFKIGNTIRESDTHLESKNNTHYIYRKLLNYNHLISK